MRFAKIVGGEIQLAPRNKPGISNWINDEVAVRAEGYYEFPEFIIPEGKRVCGYEIVKCKIIPIFEDDVKSYSELRVNEYPSIEEQLDMIYWDKVLGTNNWVNLISNIKSKYPKP